MVTSAAKMKTGATGHVDTDNSTRVPLGNDTSSLDETGGQDWPQLHQSLSERGIDIKDFPASIIRTTDSQIESNEADRVREASQGLGRRARDAFRDACETTNSDRSETSYLAMKMALEELWDYAKYRDIPFRDLLGILEAATKQNDLSAFNQTQRDVLRNAFQDLPRWLLGSDVVDRHIEKFAEFDIDITGPIRSKTPKRLRVTIEEID